MKHVWRLLQALALIAAGFAPELAQAQVRTQQAPLRSLIAPLQNRKNQNQTQTQTFVAPSVHDVRLDWCAHLARDCGQPAADLFCREMQFERATNFAIDQNIGARGVPTLVFGDGVLCQGPQCSGFRSITCVKTAVAAPIRPPPPQPPIVEQQPEEEQPVLEQPPVLTVPAQLPPPRPPEKLPPLQIAPLSPETLKDLALGDIYLDDPRVEPEWLGDIANPRAGEIPVWDDETVFKWHPSNPGMADTYDLRFYSVAEGGTPVGSIKIPGNKTYARPSIEFLAEVLESTSPGPSPKGDFWTLKAQLIGGGGPAGDLFWEVAGYRGYPSSGVAEESAGEDQGGDTFDAEVAVSERWPLLTTDAPNGYDACGPGEGQEPELNKANILLENIDGLQDAERPAGVDYVYDRIKLTGQFSLAKSPYAAHPKEIMSPPKPGQLINIDVASYAFDNLFIDWGDGTVDPLTLDSVEHGQYGRKTLLALPTKPPFAHRYLSAGTHTIRIFQVSGDDLQKVNVASLNVAFTFDKKQKAPAKAGSQPGGYYDALIQQQSGGGGSGKASAQIDPSKIPILQGGFPLEVANRAYVIYCKPVTVTEPKDEAAFGPLVLYSVDVAFDDAHAVDKSNPIEARTSACDLSIKARAQLRFAGKGRASVVWKIDGVMIGGVSEYEIGPSDARSAQELAEGAPPKQGTWWSDWVSLEVSEAMIGGGHTVTVEVKVKETLLVTRKFLRPSKEKQAGAPPVITVPIVFLYVVADDGTVPKKQVTSPARNYTVVESDSSKPCHLRFLVAGGAFDVFLPDPDAVTVSGDSVAGAGNLLVRFANQGNELSVPISFNGWQIAGDGDVVSGTLAVDGIADGKVNLPGLSVALTALSGEAGEADGAVQATINLTAEGGALRTATGAPKPPVWNGETSLLAPDGDWYRAEAKTGLPSSLMAWSGFLIDAAKAALDFSAAEGAGPGNVCGAAGMDWIGVRLDGARVQPNLFNLDTVNVPVSNWVIGEVSTGNGLCGDLDVANPVPKRPVGEGFIAIKHLGAQVRAGFVKNALYDMEVDVPILNVKLTGTGKLMETTGAAATWDLSGLTGPPADRSLGPVRLQASGYVFGTDATGWRVKTNAVLSLRAESKPFATVNATAMRVGMSGRIYFDDSGATVRTVPLGGKSKLGDSPVDLLSATLTGPASGATRLGVQVATKLKFSDTLPAPDVGATYQIVKTGGAVSAAGPQTTPFEVKIAFPAGQPGMSATINPHYVGGEAPAPGEASGVKFYAGPGDALVEMFASSSPIQSAFVLGYIGSADYWMTLTDYSLGPTGVVLVAPILNLFNVNGGLGYHVNTDSFVGLGNVKSVPPDSSKGLTFLAGMSVGTPDHQTFTLDGQLKMTEVEKVRFDFTAWILRAKSGSTGDFTGFFQYGGGSFDGQVWGGMSLLDGAVEISADQGAVDMHFGSGGPWHVYLGRREGPKIEATLLHLGGTSGFMMLSGEGYFVGSGMNINLGGSIGPFSAHVKGWLDSELGIEPLIPRVSGSASGGLSVKGCAFDLCIGPEASVTVKMAALPVDVSAKACFEVDLFIKTVGACGSVSL